MFLHASKSWFSHSFCATCLRDRAFHHPLFYICPGRRKKRKEPARNRNHIMQLSHNAIPVQGVWFKFVFFVGHIQCEPKQAPSAQRRRRRLRAAGWHEQQLIAMVGRHRFTTLVKGRPGFIATLHGERVPVPRKHPMCKRVDSMCRAQCILMLFVLFQHQWLKTWHQTMSCFTYAAHSPLIENVACASVHRSPAVTRAVPAQHLSAMKLDEFVEIFVVAQWQVPARKDVSVFKPK